MLTAQNITAVLIYVLPVLAVVVLGTIATIKYMRTNGGSLKLIVAIATDMVNNSNMDNIIVQIIKDIAKKYADSTISRYNDIPESVKTAFKSMMLELLNYTCKPSDDDVATAKEILSRYTVTEDMIGDICDTILNYMGYDDKSINKLVNSYLEEMK